MIIVNFFSDSNCETIHDLSLTSITTVSQDLRSSTSEPPFSITSSQTTIQTIKDGKQYENSSVKNSLLSLKVPSLSDLDFDDTKADISSKSDSAGEENEVEIDPKSLKVTNKKEQTDNLQQNSSNLW